MCKLGGSHVVASRELVECDGVRSDEVATGVAEIIADAVALAAAIV